MVSVTARALIGALLVLVLDGDQPRISPHAILAPDAGAPARRHHHQPLRRGTLVLLAGATRSRSSSSTTTTTTDDTTAPRRRYDNTSAMPLIAPRAASLATASSRESTRQAEDCYEFGSASGRAGWLADTNYYRQLHGAGPVEWDEDLERKAQDWANQLVQDGFSHTQTSPHHYDVWPPTGENAVRAHDSTGCPSGVPWAGRPGAPTGFNQACAVYRWWRLFQAWQCQGSFANFANFMPTFTNIAWKGVNLIGCASAGNIGEDFDSFFVCEYGSKACKLEGEAGDIYGVNTGLDESWEDWIGRDCGHTTPPGLPGLLRNCGADGTNCIGCDPNMTPGDFFFGRSTQASAAPCVTFSPTGAPTTSLSPTAAPGTVAPTTVSPTTTAPTTGTPTTVSPTATPTTASPTTLSPSASPTASPSAAPTTLSPTTWFSDNCYVYGSLDGPEGWVADHNYYRSRSGAPRLEWDQELADKALEYAKILRELDIGLPHSESYETWPGSGENLARGTGVNCPRGPLSGDYTGIYNQHCAVYRWWEEHIWWKPLGATACAGQWQDISESRMGHFTVMVWGGVDLMGCASFGEGAKEYFVCEYGSKACKPARQLGDVWNVTLGSWEEWIGGPGCWDSAPPGLPNLNPDGPQCTDMNEDACVACVLNMQPCTTVGPTINDGSPSFPRTCPGDPDETNVCINDCGGEVGLCCVDGLCLDGLGAVCLTAC